MSVALAAVTLGISERAVRKRIHAGTLRAEPFGRSFRVWLDQPPAGPEPGPVQGPEGPERGPEPIEAVYRVAGEETPSVALVPLATMVEELRGLADELATLAQRNESLALEVGTLRERTTTQETTFAELRRRAEAAEVERDSLQAMVTTTVALEASGAAPGAAVGPHTTPSPLSRWQRLWRALRGE